MKNIEISIIIPAYRAENTIQKCISSIKGENIEIILVSDGDTEQTVHVYEKLAEQDKRIRLIKQENKGAFLARKKGIENSKGKYLMFLDSDDCYTDTTVETMKKLIQKYNQPDLIRFRYKKEPKGYEQYRYFEEEEKYIQGKKELKEKVYPMFLKGYQLNSIWNNCVKKELIEKMKIESNIKRYGEDLALNLQLFTKAEKVVFTEQILYIYNFSEESITTTTDYKKLILNLQDAINVYSSIFEYLEIWGLNTVEYQKIVIERLKKETEILIKKITNSL